MKKITKRKKSLRSKKISRLLRKMPSGTLKRRRFCSIKVLRRTLKMAQSCVWQTGPTKLELKGALETWP